MDIKLLFVIVAVTIIGAMIMAAPLCKEMFRTSTTIVTFFDQTQTSAFLMDDKDGYVSNLSPQDLLARKAKSSDHYKSLIVQDATSISEQEKQLLTENAKKVDAYLRKLKSNDSINYQVLADIPWVFAFTKGTVYENGYPHTRANVIFIPTHVIDSIDLPQTMLHEKIHVYQRMYPSHMSSYLQQNGYVQWKQRLGEPLVRANPDLDPWIYIDPRSSKPMVAYYTSNTPSSISDVTMDHPAFEHPYEQMAYAIASQLPNSI